MKFKLNDVQPNPFRDMARYPIHAQKIAQLKKSIETTDFWDNIVARKTTDGKGIQIAYGHHRLTALREMFPGTKEFDFIVRDLTDTDMLKIMAHENLDEWGHDSGIERETIRAVVTAFANNRIALAKPSKESNSSNLRYAPSFCFINQQVNDAPRENRGAINRSHPYNADTIGAFLGGTMSNDTIKFTLQALCLIENGYLQEDQLQGLSSNECRTVIVETERSIKQSEAIKKEAERKAMNAPTPVLQKQIVKDAEKKAKVMIAQTTNVVAKAMQAGEGARQAKQAATDVRVKVSGVTGELPEINAAAGSVSAQLQRLLDPEHLPGSKIEELIKFKKHLSPTSLQNLNRALEIVVEYAEGYRSRLK